MNSLSDKHWIAFGFAAVGTGSSACRMLCLVNQEPKVSVDVALGKAICC